MAKVDKIKDREVRKSMQKQADDIKAYMEIFERFVIPTDLSEEVYKKHKKNIKKLIKKLEAGDISCYREDVQDNLYEKLL